MGLCKSCKNGVTRHGLLFTNYWCEKYSAMYYDNVSSCPGYAKKEKCCLDCAHYCDRACSLSGKEVNRTRAACSAFEER